MSLIKRSNDKAPRNSAVRMVLVYLLLATAMTICATSPVMAAPGELTFVEAQFDGVAGVDGLDGVFGVDVSPDGQHVYVTSIWDDAVAVFSRDTTTGELLFVEAEFDGVDGVDGLAHSNYVVVSPDGQHVYATGVDDNAVAVFSRNATTGELTFVEAEFDGVDGVDGLAMSLGVSVSPDGAHVYVCSFEDDAVALFSRNATTGELTFVEAEFGGWGGVNGLRRPAEVAVSPGGDHVYVTDHGDVDLAGGVAVFSRNATTGEMSFVELHVASGTIGLMNPTGLAVSPDGAHVYAGAFGGSVTAFSRNATTGELTFVEAEFDGVDGVDGLDGGVGLAVSPDGQHVYATGMLDRAVAVFSRNATTGELTFVEAQFDGVGGVDGLDGARLTAVSPDGQHVYVCGLDDDAVAVFSILPHGVVKARITIPKEGKRISGNRVTVMAEIVGQIEDVDNVLFQYRLVPSSTWLNIPAANVNNPNPDTTHPFFVHWDVSGLPSPSTCELRAVATSITQTPDPDPEIRTVIIDHGGPDHSEGMNGDGNQELHSSLLAAEQNELGSADPRSNIVVALTIPPDGLPGDTGGTILFPPAADYLSTLGEYDSHCDAYVDLALDAGDLTGGKKVFVKVHYPDADQDGLIDGTTLSELGLVLCSYETDTWVPLEFSTVNPVRNTVRGLTTHLSSFGLIGQDDDGDGLTNEFEGTVSSTSRTDSDTDADGVSDYDEVAYDGDADNYNPYDPDTNPTGTDLDANDPDTDGDEQSDAYEVEYGSDPLDATSVVPAFTVVGLVVLCLAMLVLGLLLWTAKCSRAGRPVPAQES